MASSDSIAKYDLRATDVHEIQVNVQEIDLLLEELKRIKGLQTKVIYENENSNDDISCNITENKIHENLDAGANDQKAVSQGNSRKYQCHICFKEYSYKKGLLEHTRNVHEGKKSQCKICNEDFVNNSGLRRHVTNVHKIKVHNKSLPLADENEIQIDDLANDESNEIHVRHSVDDPYDSYNDKEVFDENEIHKDNLANDELSEIHVRHPVDDTYDSYNDEEVVDPFEEINDNSAAEFIKQETIFDDEDFCRSALQFEEKFFSDENINNVTIDKQDIDIKENLKSEIDDTTNCNGGEEEEIYDDQQDEEEHFDILENEKKFKKESSVVVDNLDSVLKLHKLDPKSLQQYQSTKRYGQKKKLLQSLCDIQDRKETLGILTQPHKLSDNVWVCHFCYNTFSSKYR